jgi:hypothetical protein
MAMDRDRRVFAKAGNRYLKQFSFSYAALLAVILIFNASPSRAQQAISESASTPVVSDPQQAQPNSVPSTLTLASGVQIHLRTADYLSTEDDGNGAHFIGVLVQPVVVDGWVVARAGQYIVGQISNSDKKSTLQLSLSQLILVDGNLVQIQTSVASMAKDAPPQSLLTLTLVTDATFSTTKGRVAFRAVTAADYSNFPLGNAPTKIPFGYDPPCCVDQHGYGQFAGDGYGYEYYYGAGYVPPPIQIRYYGWHGNRWGW